MQEKPGIGSPVIGQQLGIHGLCAWRLSRFPMSVWYFDRGDQVLVVRVVEHRQDAEGIDLERHAKTRRLVDLVGILDKAGELCDPVSIEEMKPPER